MVQSSLRHWLRSLIVATTFVMGCNTCQQHCCRCCHCCHCGEDTKCSGKLPDKVSSARAENKTAPAPLAETKLTLVEKPAEPVATEDAAGPNVEKEPVVKRRSNSDNTANPAFGHAQDYSWVCGELKHYDVSNVWRVRYASVEEEDRYNGSVTLMGAGPMTEFKSGQIVRVCGHLADADSSVPNPVYVVDNIQPADQSH